MIDIDYLNGCVETEEICKNRSLTQMEKAYVYARNIDSVYYVQIINTKHLPATQLEIKAFTVQYYSLIKIPKSDYEIIVIDDDIIIFVLYKKFEGRITLRTRADREWGVDFNIPNMSDIV